MAKLCGTTREQPPRSRSNWRIEEGLPGPRFGSSDRNKKKRMATPLSVVILAAGLGTRMKSKRAKVLHRAGGLALVEHVVRAARGIASPENITVVVGHGADQVKALLAPTGVHFADQTAQKGTGHALMVSRGALESLGGYVVVLYGDCPLLTSATLHESVQRQTSGSAAATVIATRL